MRILTNSTVSSGVYSLHSIYLWASNNRYSLDTAWTTLRRERCARRPPGFRRPNSPSIQEIWIRRIRRIQIRRKMRTKTFGILRCRQSIHILWSVEVKVASLGDRFSLLRFLPVHPQFCHRFWWWSNWSRFPEEAKTETFWIQSWDRSRLILILHSSKLNSGKLAN